MLFSEEARKIPAWKRAAAAVVGLPLGLALVGLGRTLRVAVEGASHIPRDGRPLVFVAWHRFTWVATGPALQASPLREVPWLGHDRFASLFFTVPSSLLGMRFYTFSLASEVPGTRQISGYLREGRSIVIFGDSGGPYGTLKPGVVKLAKACGAYVVPVGFEAAGKLTLGARLRHLLPIPFSRVACRFGEASDCARVPEDGIEAETARIQARLEELSRAEPLTPLPSRPKA